MTIERSSEEAAPAGPKGGARRRRRRRVVLGVVTVLSLGTLAAIVLPYLGFDPEDSKARLREDVPFHFPLLMTHLLTGSVALLLGPLQFFGPIRRRAPRAHRLIGRVYLLAGVVPSGIAGFGVALLTREGPVAGAGFALLSVFWLVSAGCGYAAVRRRDFRAHERWMRRNFAATFAAVTLRAWLGLLIFAQLPLLEPVYSGEFDALFSVAYTAAAWLCWVPNVLLIEWWVRTNGRAPVGGKAAVRPA
ncbi:DUF2306 domain-containing protein [Streptomonospora wellingtoniae]|uniref:DUF2306 domain-containing protein n=1 Tax=Streptomonospora wellingtoniae TaxID=3075544 RepID=A0ABU2KNG7_9ACTN|nr:DUF2306 domain-containing protein [Streptomonospora sp. DSM 45055]MDT0300814.1 DUF2306 domain-containing protein [Streptomonospora sp. DSM 45055]